MLFELQMKYQNNIFLQYNQTKIILIYFQLQIINFPKFICSSETLNSNILQPT